MTKYYLQHPLNPAIFVEVPRNPDNWCPDRLTIQGKSCFQSDNLNSISELQEIINYNLALGFNEYFISMNEIEFFRWETKEESSNRIRLHQEKIADYEGILKERKSLLEKLYQERLQR